MTDTNTIANLEAENARLRAEVERLTACVGHLERWCSEYRRELDHHRRQVGRVAELEEAVRVLGEKIQADANINLMMTEAGIHGWGKMVIMAGKATIAWEAVMNNPIARAAAYPEPRTHAGEETDAK